MPIFNAHKFEIRVLDDELTDSEELAEWISEAISLYCEVNHVEITVLECHENVMSHHYFEMADA